MSRFTRKAPFTGIGQAAGQDPAQIKTLGNLMVSKNIETKRRENLDAGLTNPKKFLEDKRAALASAKASAIDVVFVAAYQFIQKLTDDDEEARKKSYKIAMAYKDLLEREVDKVYPSNTSQRIIFDRPIPSSGAVPAVAAKQP